MTCPMDMKCPLFINVIIKSPGEWLHSSLQPLYIGSISASPTACLLRGYGRAGTQNDRLGEVVIFEYRRVHTRATDMPSAMPRQGGYTPSIIYLPQASRSTRRSPARRRRRRRPARPSVFSFFFFFSHLGARRRRKKKEAPRGPGALVARPSLRWPSPFSPSVAAPRRAPRGEKKGDAALRRARACRRPRLRATTRPHRPTTRPHRPTTRRRRPTGAPMTR